MNKDGTTGLGKGKLLVKFVPLLIVFGGIGVVAIIAILPVAKESVRNIPQPDVNVKVEEVVAIPTMPDEFELDGSVEPNRLVRVAAEVDGRIERYGPYTGPDVGRKRQQLDEGDSVRAGQALMYLNTELLQASFNQAKAQYEKDQRDYARFAEARQMGVATQKELDEARAAVELSKATLDEFKAKLDRTTIFAPVSGVINRMNSEVGEYVQPGMTCAEIVDNETVKIIVNVPEQDISYFAIGQEQIIVLDHQSQPEAITGPITYISEVAEPVARTTRMEISVPNTDRRLHSGLFVGVRLKRRHLKNVIMVPLDAIIPLEDGYMVYVVEDGKSQPRTDVSIDIRFIKGKRIRVLSGLEAGDKLILFPSNRLCGPGQKVRVIGEESLLPDTESLSTQQQQEN